MRIRLKDVYKMNQIFRILKFFWPVLFIGLTPDVFSQGKRLHPEAVDRTISAWIDSGYYDGGNMLIGNRRGVIFQKSYGTYRPDTKVHIASAGKWLAAATLAAVTEHSELRWTDKASKWIPELEGDPKGEVTLAQLMSHTANYPDYQPAERHRDDYQSLQESVERLLDLPLRADMNKPQFYYGGLAMQVAGRMAEKATGKTWETLFRKYIANPLRMDNSHFIPVDSVAGGHSPMLGGGAVSTVEDYGRFLQMFINKGVFKGERVLSKVSVEFLIADQVKNALVTDEGSGNYVKKVRGYTHTGIYGIGLWREKTDKKGRATLISSPGWAGTYPWIDFEKGIYGFFITHIKDGMMGKNGFSSFWSSPKLADILFN